MMRRNHHAHRPEHPPLLESDDDQEDDDNVDDRFGLLDTVRLFDGNDNEERNSSGHSSSTTTNGDEEALHGHWKVEPFPIVMRDPSKSPLTTPQRRRAAKGHHRGTEHTLPNSGGGSLGLRIRRILRSSTASSSLAILLALGGGAFLASVLILSSALVGVPSRGLVVDPIAAASRVVVVVIPRPPTSSSTTTVNRRKVQLPRRKLKPKKVLSSGGGTGYDTADYGGLYIDVFEEDGAARAIYHDFSLDETKAERHPRDPEEETVDAYYAYDDDARRNPYRYQPKHSGKRCRRTKLHRRSPLNCNSVYELDLFSALRKVGRSQYVGYVEIKKHLRSTRRARPEGRSFPLSHTLPLFFLASLHTSPRIHIGTPPGLDRTGVSLCSNRTAATKRMCTKPRAYPPTTGTTTTNSYGWIVLYWNCCRRVPTLSTATDIAASTKLERLW